MDSSRRRSVSRGSVAAGSVWETRMKNDEIKGGNLNEFDSEKDEINSENPKIESVEEDEKINDEINDGVAGNGKRKTWKSENSVKKTTKSRSEFGNLKMEQRKEMKKMSPVNPIQVKKGRSENFPVKKGSPVQMKKLRSEIVEGNEKSPNRIRKLRSELSKGSDEIFKDDVKSVRLKKEDSVETSESESNFQSDHPKEEEKIESCEEIEKKPDEIPEFDESIEEIEKNPDEITELGVCEEKINLQIHEQEQENQFDDPKDEQENEEQEEQETEEEIDEEIEVETKRIDVKEMNEIKQKPVESKIRVLDEVKKLHQQKNGVNPSSSTVIKLPPPVIKRATAIHHSPPTKAPCSDTHQNFPQTQSKLQSLVDLVMWKDISRSALIFGIGTFIIISSSYTNDLKISIISVISYVGLVYLAAIFFYRSVLCRGYIEMNEKNYVIGEEEALWFLRLILPYFNEFLLKLKALFSGDPATTMKLAVLLFVLARCGSSITIWKMAKLGFFGVFTVPKIFTSYSATLAIYGKFWVRRFRDAWDTCTHKKAVAFVVFAAVWNMSSVVARVWAAFMVFVAVRYYQQKLAVENGWLEEDPTVEEPPPVQRPMRRQRPERPSVASNVNLLPNKLKKRI